MSIYYGPCSLCFLFFCLIFSISVSVCVFFCLFRLLVSLWYPHAHTLSQGENSTSSLQPPYGAVSSSSPTPQDCFPAPAPFALHSYQRSQYLFLANRTSSSTWNQQFELYLYWWAFLGKVWMFVHSLYATILLTVKHILHCDRSSIVAFNNYLALKPFTCLCLVLRNRNHVFFNFNIFYYLYYYSCPIFHPLILYPYTIPPTSIPLH